MEAPCHVDEILIGLHDFLIALTRFSPPRLEPLHSQCGAKHNRHYFHRELARSARCLALRLPLLLHGLSTLAMPGRRSAEVPTPPAAAAPLRRGRIARISVPVSRR